jgi:hypothetical protein
VLYWKLLGGGLQMLFEIQKQMNNVWGYNLLWLTGLSTHNDCIPSSRSTKQVRIWLQTDTESVHNLSFASSQQKGLPHRVANSSVISERQFNHTNSGFE